MNICQINQLVQQDHINQENLINQIVRKVLVDKIERKVLNKQIMRKILNNKIERKALTIQIMVKALIKTTKTIRKEVRNEQIAISYQKMNELMNFFASFNHK